MSTRRALSERRRDICAFLAEHGAAVIPHPGGTLAAHLDRVGDWLARLGATDRLVLAAWTHAGYGTDGFGIALLDHTRDRDRLRALVGAEAEDLVYRYGGCARAVTWPRFAEHRTVTSRFTGAAEVLEGDELRELVDLTVANELDVFRHAEPGGGPHAEIRRLVTEWAPLASPQVAEQARLVCDGR